MSQQPPPFWRVSAFSGLLGDPFIGGTDLQGGHIANSLVQLHNVISRIQKSCIASRQPDKSEKEEKKEKEEDDDNKSQAPDPLGDCLNLWEKEDLEELVPLLSILEASAKTAMKAAKCESPEDMTKFLGPFMQLLSSIKLGETMFVPGGWLGLTKMAFVLFIIEKRDNDDYSFTVCNVGEGLEYHPSRLFSQPEAPHSDGFDHF